MLILVTYTQVLAKETRPAIQLILRHISHWTNNLISIHPSDQGHCSHSTKHGIPLKMHFSGDYLRLITSVPQTENINSTQYKSVLDIPLRITFNSLNMQFSSLSLVFLAVIGAIANPIAVDSELENRDVQLSKYGGVCSCFKLPATTSQHQNC